MIQFNLLPDVKLEYVRVQRLKHTVISGAVLAASGAFAIFLLLFVTVNVVQRQALSAKSNDIKKYSAELKNTPDLNKILTIQNQLAALPGLHAQKPATSRLFSFIQQITPQNVLLTDFADDYVANTMVITGQTTSLDRVNTFVDTLKYTKYADKTTTDGKAFTSVVLSQFARSSTATNYTITATYVPALFDNASPAVALTVPFVISTQSVTDQPVTIFQKATTNATN